MNTSTEDFTVQVDGVKGNCPVGEEWADQRNLQKKIPVLACEGPCIRGEIARLAANRVAKKEPFARACFPEAFFVPHSGMNRWIKEADQVVMIDGCFLKCIGRVLNNLVDETKITPIDAMQYYQKYIELFDMEDIHEAERIETANQVADQILARLRDQ